MVAVTLTATVHNATTGATPTGAVEFFDGPDDLGAGAAQGGSGGTATWALVTTALGAGSHALRASYRPADVFLPSSGTATHTVVSPHTLTVTTLSDGGPGSLRALLAQAVNGDTIGFDPALSGTLTLTSGELQVGTNVAVVGPAAGLTLSGNFSSRVLEVLPGATVSVSGLTIAQGGEVSGGGIANRGTLLLGGVSLLGNWAAQQGGALYNAGGLTLTDGFLYGNACGGDGGAVYNAAGATLTVRGSTVYGNGALDAGGGLYNAGSAAVATSTVAADSSASGGGLCNAGGSLTLATSAVYDNGATDGGGLYNLNGTLTVNNSTLAQNYALGDGAGLWTGGASPGAVTLTNVTLTANYVAAGGHGGGIFVGSGLPLLRNSLVAGNYGGPDGATRDDVYGALDGAGGNNVIADGTGMTGLSFGVNGNFVGTSGGPFDPQLGPLQDNGGPTLTCATAPNSLARHLGNPDYADPDATDQRGEARVADGVIDAGAYQAQPGE
jgi:hypothetical protein